MSQNVLGKDNLIKKLVSKFDLEKSIEKVILFGSYSNGNIDEFSDMDLLIILKNQSKAKSRDELIKRKLFYKTLLSKDFPVPLDVIVYTKEEWEKLKNLNTSFIKEIKETGKVIYER